VTLADRIIVLENGAITENGTHFELMDRRGRYYDMYSKQASRF
jgi:ATP-binding cassette subfamily B protein